MQPLDLSLTGSAAQFWRDCWPWWLPLVVTAWCAVLGWVTWAWRAYPTVPWSWFEERGVQRWR